eukprot:798010-Pyramimonas_sp.AAC.1
MQLVKAIDRRVSPVQHACTAALSLLDCAASAARTKGPGLSRQQRQREQVPLAVGFLRRRRRGRKRRR